MNTDGSRQTFLGLLKGFSWDLSNKYLQLNVGFKHLQELEQLCKILS